MVKKVLTFVAMNNKAVDEGVGALVKVEVPAAWKDAKDSEDTFEKSSCTTCPSYVANIAKPVNAQAGYDLPVSAFTGYEDGTLPSGTAAFEKRGAALFVPHWSKKTVSNVTNVPSYVHMRLSVLY